MRYLLLLLATFLLGCAQTTGTVKGTGTAVPPDGYIKLCKEHPEVAACPKKPN